MTRRLSNQDLLLRGVSEAQWQDQLTSLALLNGYLVYHTHRSDRSQPGYPDLTLVRASPPDVLWVECKTETGRVSPDQQHWLDTLKAAGHDAYLWRPRHWDDAVTRLTRPPKGRDRPCTSRTQSRLGLPLDPSG